MKIQRSVDAAFSGRTPTQPSSDTETQRSLQVQRVNKEHGSASRRRAAGRRTTAPRNQRLDTRRPSVSRRSAGDQRGEPRLLDTQNPGTENLHRDDSIRRLTVEEFSSRFFSFLIGRGVQSHYYRPLPGDWEDWEDWEPWEPPPPPPLTAIERPDGLALGEGP
ncbi:unnamed protein product [Arctogadus glacialis]